MISALAISWLLMLGGALYAGGIPGLALGASFWILLACILFQLKSRG